MLVMKALSLGLVKGSIDEIDQKVHMTWVQPRVLDLQQVSFVCVCVCSNRYINFFKKNELISTWCLEKCKETV